MKKFIATISYFGDFTSGSTIRLVEASKKAVAQKRAEKYAAEAFTVFKNRVVIVEELTPAKEKALDAALTVIEEEYKQIASVRGAINRCRLVSEGYFKI